MGKWQDSAKQSIVNRNSNTNSQSDTTNAGAKSSGSWQQQAKQSLDSRGYIPPENRAYEIKLNNSTNFGTVSYGAYKAIQNDTLDKYVPKNDDEKNTLDSFKAYVKEQAQKQEEKEKQNRINSNPVTKKYGIDPDNFTQKDFEKWAEEHGFEYRMGGNDLTGAEYKWLPKQKGGWKFWEVVPSKEEQSDKKALEALAENNQRKAASKTDKGAVAAAVVNAIDGLTFGAVNAYADWDAKRDYKKAGFDENDFVSYSQAQEKTTSEHKIASAAGNIAGSLVSLGGLSKAVGAATSGVKWIAKAPGWVQSAINSGITFAVQSGAETAFDGGNFEDVLKSAGINLVGGAVGGGVSGKVGSIGEKLLFDKGLQHKVIPEMIRTGVSSATFAGSKTASTYFLYPEDYRPTKEEMAKDITTAFAFGAISSGINTIKTSSQNKKYLDELYQKMAADYESMAKSNISGKDDTAGIQKFAKNVIGYSNAMEAYLTGKEYNATIDGETYTFTPNKIRLVGQDKYVNSILGEIDTIRNNANAVLNGIETPSAGASTASAPTNTVSKSAGAIAQTASVAVPNANNNPVSSDSSTPIIASAAAAEAVKPQNTPTADTVIPQTAVKANASGELGEIMDSEPIATFTPETASNEIKRLENILIAKGADDTARKEIIDTAVEIEKTLDGSDENIRSVFNDVSKITSTAISEIQNQAGLSSAYWKLFGENFKTVPTGNAKENISLVTEYSNAYAEALKNNNPEKYNSVMLSADGQDLSAELPETVMQNNIPNTVQNAGQYRLIATQIKNIINAADVQLVEIRNNIYGDDANAPVEDNTETTEVQPVTEPKNITLTRMGDFYEAFGDEALELANKLNLTPTYKTVNGVKTAMVGFPAHTLEKYQGALGNDYNLVISDNTVNTLADKATVIAQNQPVSGGADVVDHTKGVEGLKLIDAEKSTLADGKTLVTGVYELNSDKDFNRKSYKKEKFDIFIAEAPYVKSVDGTTYGHYGIAGDKAKGYMVTYLPAGVGVAKADTQTTAKALLEALENDLPELPLTIKAYGDKYRCYGIDEAVKENVKNVIDSVTENTNEITLPLKNKKELISYLKNHKGDKIGVTYNNGTEDVRTIVSASDTAIVTEQADGQRGNLRAKANELSYTDDGFVYTGSNGVTVSYRFIDKNAVEKVADNSESVISDNASTIPYTDKEKQNWENSKDIIVYESDEQLEAFIEKVLKNEDTHKKIYFGKIPDKTAQMVLDKTGIDVSGHNIALKGYEIRKILLNSHGDEKVETARGQEPITMDDLKNIPSVITNPDDVSLSEKEYEGKPALLFEKTIDGKNYVVAYVSRKHHDIAIQTMYKKRSLATAENANALSSTPETTSSTASNNIVSQNNDIVNSSVRNETENDTFNLTDKCDIITTKHTQTNEDLWVVTLKEKLSADDYEKLKNKVKTVGGYYSRFPKTPEGKAAPGFVFKTEPTEKELSVFNDFFGYATETAPVETKSGIKKIDTDALLDTSRNEKTDDEIMSSEHKKQTQDEQLLTNASESDIIEEKIGKEDIKDVESKSELLAGESKTDGGGLRTGTDGINEEQRTDKTDKAHRDTGGEILSKSVGTDGNRPDVRNDSERVHGSDDAGNASSKNAGISARIAENEPEIIETEVKTVEKKRPSNKGNFVITNDIAEEFDNTPPNAKDNIEAIELLITLENEGRAATAEEKKILAKYKGWGGIDTRYLPYSLSARLDGLFDSGQKKAMQSSQNNAFFTPTKVIDAIYAGLKRMGFKGGNVLETSMGVGNFFGRMPSTMSSKSALTGVELESYTARIAQYLYPGATVINKPFQDVAIKNGSYDLVIGNVPFGQNKISYNKKKYSLHNYFIISSLDKVRDGGIVAVITSASTLDSHSIDARKAIMDRADVIACYKLPEKVFSRNASTDVQSDLLILRKRASSEKPKGDSILNTITTSQGFRINEYFDKHPENVLGTLAKGTNAWGEITTVQDDGSFYDKLNTAMKKLPKDLISGKTELKSIETIVSLSDKPRFFEKNGKVYADDGAGTATEVSKNQANTVRDYIAVRDAYKELLNAYDNGETVTAADGTVTIREMSDEDIKPLRDKLSKAYDNFYEKHGAITGDGKKKIGNKKSTNNTFLEADADYYLVGGLERYDTENNAFVKSALFEKDTLRKKKVTSVDSASDALAVSLNESGKIDFARMQELTGKNEKQLAEELKGEIVLTPEGDYVLTDIYLSGNIYEKLEAVKGKPEFKEQQEMLEKVIPTPKDASDIAIKLGANYIDAKTIEQFAKEIFNTPLTIRKDISGRWVIEGVRQSRYGDIVNVKYGCDAFNAVQLLEKILNDGEITATKKVRFAGKDVTALDAEMTDVARQKADDIRAAFETWLFSNSERRTEIVDSYNRTYNNYRPLDYERIAEKLSFDSMDDTLKSKLYPHQKKGIARFLFGGNILFAHGVGTGKTFEMISAVREAKRMGIINKAAMVVPNNKVVDFKKDIAQSYPTAKVLVVDTANKKRQTMLGLVNSNDWDIVLIARTTFTKIPVSPEFQTHYIAQQLEDMELQIAEAEKDRSVSRRQLKSMITQRDNLEQKIKDLGDETKRDTNSVDFERLGIDCICVDEAHNYKSILTPTKLNIKGLVNKNNAQMANDMLMKLDYLRSINGKIIFGTGTPITNTVSEIYNMMRMVRPDILEDAGIHSLDEWVNTFAKIDTVTEIGIDNQIKNKSTQIIRSFVNVSEMVGMFRQFADIVFTDDVVKNLPKAVYKDVMIEGTDEHRQIENQISDVLARTQKSDLLKVHGKLMSMADVASVDLRMLSGAESEYNIFKDYSLDELDYEGSKINVMCNNVYDEYTASNDIKGTQIIFCDKGSGSGNVYSFNLHNDIKQKLIERGIPEEQIVIIKSQSDAQLEALYDKVNAGEVRVLIGTSAKMAEGLNVQKRVVAIHHPTVTYKPSDWEQGNARGIRAGNINDEVRIYRYLQENTFDSHKWQAQDRKSEMINKALRGDAIAEMEDIGADEDSGAGVDAATAMAITSGNPLVKEKIDIDKEVVRLKTLQRNHLSEVYRYQDAISKNPNMIKQLTNYADNIEQDIVLRDKYEEKTSVVIKGKTFEKQSDANKALSEAVKTAPKNGKYTKLGTYNGFDIMFKGDTGGMGYSVVLKGSNEYTVDYAGSGNNMARFAGVLKRLDAELTRVRRKVETLKSDLEIAEKEVSKPFEKEKELTEALEKQKDITYRYEHYGENSEVSETTEATDTENNADTIDLSNDVVDDGTADIGSEKYSIDDYASSGGYSGYSMSNRAVEAYDNGEKPLSRWTKSDIIEEIEYLAEEAEIKITTDDLKKLSLKELKDNFLEKSSWHHTSMFYNKTDFYRVSVDKISNVAKNGVDKIISNRQRKSSTNKELEARKVEKTALKQAQDVYKKLEVIFEAGVTSYKTIKGLSNGYLNGKIDLDKTYSRALDEIKQRDKQRVEQWKKLPEGHRRHKTVELYNSDDIEGYVFAEHPSLGKTTNNAIIQSLKKGIITSLHNENLTNNVKEITESEDLLNEQSRNDLLSGNSGRAIDESTGKQAKRVSSYKQRLEGKTRAERKNTAKELTVKGYAEEVVHGNHKYTLIKEDGYNDDMRSIVAEAKAYGKEVGFFIGNAVRKFDGQRNFKIDGIKLSDNKILIRYDGTYSPQALLMHELVHTEWDNPEMQKAKDIILSDLSESDKKEILQNGRYKDYMDLYKGDEDAVWEEFIADIFADMNKFSDSYIDTAVDYWYNDKVIDRYNPSEYIKSIDTGGNEAVLDNIGLGNEYSLSGNNFDIPYNEKRQLDDYVLRKNHSSNKLKKVDCKEIGNNFYVWENNSKTDYTVVNMIEIDGNEDLISILRKDAQNGSFRTRESIRKAVAQYNGRFGSSNRSGIDDTRRRKTSGNGSVVGKVRADNGRGNIVESGGNKQTKYSLNSYDTDSESLTPERKKAIFEQWEKDRAGIEKPTKRQLWGERAEWVAHNATRVFPNIPERGEKGTFFAEFRKDMIQWKNLPATASFMVQDKLNKMTDGLTPDEFKTFSELVYFLDLQEEAQIQKDRGFDEILLPNEITPKEVDEIVKVLNGEATDKVQQALIKRQNIWDELKQQYIDLNSYIGFDTDGKFKRKNYYHHQVIDYMNKDKGGTGSREIGIKAGRGWLKERQGSTKAINTDFLAVEYKAMMQMQYDVYIAETLGKIKQQYDIKPKLEKEAFEHNKKALNDIIQKECTDKDGNVILDSKGKPDSETYRKQKWYNSRIMWGFNGLFDLAERGELSDYDGEYTNVVEAFKKHDLNADGLYKYVGILSNLELPDNATDGQEQAVQNARTILKYTAQKKAWVKELLADDYQTWETLAKSMSDTHSIHQPRRGNYFYTKTILDEDAFNKAHDDMVLSLVSGEVDLGNVDVKKLFEQYSDTVRLTGAAYEQWVLPKEIVTTMDEIANPKQASEGAKVARSIVSAWKGWATSVNPLRTVKFGLRNLAGDLDAVIAGNPKVTLYSKQAVQEIYQAMKHKNYSDDFMEWVKRGGYTSMIFANEMDTEMQDKLFSHLKDKQGTSVFKIPVKAFEKYYDGVENVHNFREAILRYSAYLYFKDEINKNSGNVKDYAASNKYIVKGLNSVEDKAYQLSKDLLGAYDEVGKLGQTLRRYWIPFYSFTETNMKRYYRMFENIITSDDEIPKKAGKLLLKALMANMLMLITIAWNKLVMKEQDDKLPPSTRDVPHITLGQIGDNVYAFRQLGSFSELLEWVGLDDYKWTKEDLTAPIDKAWGMITPFVKMPVELASGLNFYPSLTQPRAIRDKWQHFFNSLGVDDVYNEVTGKPTRGVGEILKGSVIYNYDYKESAYYEILDIKREWQGSESGSIYKSTPKSNALYYMKTAIRYKDKDAALKYLDEYFENGGTAKGIKQSIATLNPMYGFTGKDTAEQGNAFIASLSDEEKEKLKIAQDFYENDLMLPQEVTDKLGKKDITDEEAKTLLRNYINAKCK